MVDTKENLVKKLKTFGLDILDKKDNTDLFLKLVKKSNKLICEILLNQKNSCWFWKLSSCGCIIFS